MLKSGVFWDYDNVHIPKMLNTPDKLQFVLPRIRDFLVNHHHSGDVTFQIFGANTISENLSTQLTSIVGFPHVTITEVPEGKDSYDLTIINQVMKWVKRNEAPARILLISGDRDYANLLHRLRMENYEICLASNNKDVRDASLPLASSAFHIWKLDDIVTEEEEDE